MNSENLQKQFKKLSENNQLSHAYLFFGEDGGNHSRKFSFSVSFANFLENKKFEESTGLLKETLIISPDEEKNSIGIDKIRDLKFFLWQKPLFSARRIAIIQGAENMTPEAQNAALKIVEEPPESALIIFIAPSGESLLPALGSRLQKVYFSSGEEKPRAKTAQLSVDKLLAGDDLSDVQIDEFFRQLISKLGKDPVKNTDELKEVLGRLTAIKQFNVNKRLQLKTLK